PAPRLLRCAKQSTLPGNGREGGPTALAYPTTNQRSLACRRWFSMLTLNNIEVVYDGVILVLKGVSLVAREGAITTLLGANAARRAPLSPGRLFVGRRAADAGDRPRADVGTESHPARRALAGACTALHRGHQPGNSQAQGRAQPDGGAGRAERRAGARGGRPR